MWLREVGTGGEMNLERQIEANHGGLNYQVRIR